MQTAFQSGQVSSRRREFFLIVPLLFCISQPRIINAEEKPGSGADSKLSIEAAIADLHSKEYQKRVRAEFALLKSGDSGVNSIEKAIETENNNRKKIALKATRDYLNSSVCQGLRVVISSSKESLTSGDKTEVITKIFNDTDHTINLRTGYGPQEPQENDFEDGGSFKILQADKAGGPTEQKAEYRVVSGFSAFPIFASIPAKSSVSYSCEIVIGEVVITPPLHGAPTAPHAADGPTPISKPREVQGADASKKDPVFLMGQTQNAFIRGAVPGKYSLRASIFVDIRARGHKGLGYDFDEKAKYWAGDLVSNDVPIEIIHATQPEK